MRDTLDIPCEGLAHDHTHLELSVDHMKRRGNYFCLRPVELREGIRSMILFGEDGSVRCALDTQARLNTKKMLSMRALIFDHVDQDKLVQAFKERDKERVISLVIDALQGKGRAAA